MLRLCAALLLMATAAGAQPASPDLASIVKGVDLADAARRSGLGSYTVIRTYNLLTSPDKPPAEMQVRLTYSPGGIKSFEIINMQNAEGIRKRIFQRMLDGETEAAKFADQTHINSANYEFAYIGRDQWEGQPCYVLKLTPKRKDKYLIEGQVWIDAQDYGVAKITGRPGASLSFWVGKPYMTQEFRKEGRFWLASRNETLSDVKVVGKTKLTIRYGAYQFAGLPTSSKAIQHATARLP